jgi:hypothetical protein
MGLKGFMNSMSKPKMQTGGKTPFGMLSVKAGYDNNPNPTAADRIVGAKKKGQKGMETKPTADSTAYYKKDIKAYDQLIKREPNTPMGKSNKSVYMDYKSKAYDNLNRQSLKGKPGYDKNGYPITKPKGQMGMNIKKETLKNATPSIPNSYYQMGGKKEENPLSTILKKNIKQKPMVGKAVKEGISETIMPAKKSVQNKKKMQLGGRFMPGLPVATATEGKDFVNKQSFKKGGMTKKKK